MATKRRYSDTDKATALAYLEACKGNYEQTAKKTGIPWTTIRDWSEGRGISEEVPFLQRKSAIELADAFEEKINLLTAAIDQSKISEAPLVQITTAIGTLVDKVQILRNATAVTPEEMERRQQLVAEIIARHVSDPKEREAIAAELDRLGQGDSDASTTGTGEGAFIRSMDTDEGN